MVCKKTPWSRISLCTRIRFWMVSKGLPRPYVAMDGVGRRSDTIQTSIKSHFGWCWKVFWHHPLAMYGLRRPFETTQNLILMHKLIWIWGVSESTVYGPQALASLWTWDLIVHGPLLMTSGGHPSLETCSNVFTSGPLPPIADIWWLLKDIWSALVGRTHPTGMLFCHSFILINLHSLLSTWI